MPYTQIASDNFNRATLGSNWANVDVGSSGSVSIDASTRLISQYETLGGNHKSCIAWVGAGTFTADQASHIAMSNPLAFTGVATAVGVTVRTSGSDATLTQYEAFINCNSGATPSTVIAKRVAGVYTSLYSAPLAWAANDVIGLQVVGSTLSLLKNYALVGGSFVITDTAITTGAPGAIQAGTAANNNFGDNWEAGSVTVDTTPPTMTGTVTITPSSTTASCLCPTAADNTAVTAYDASIDNGVTWPYTSATPTVVITGLIALTNYTGKFRARDAAGNTSTPVLSQAFTTTAAGTALGISAQPANQSVTAPATATFSVTATGGSPAYSYQWKRNATNIAGATSSSYITPATSVTGGTANNGDTYNVVVTDSLSATVTSTSATLTVAAAADTTPPTMTGTVTVTPGSTTASCLCPTATDNVAVSAYDASIDSGTTWPFTSATSTVVITGLTASTAYTTARFRARDAAGNVSTPVLSQNFTTTAAAGAATAVTLTGPSSGTVSVASTAFTVGANGTITGTVVVTPNDSAGGGTFTPTTVSISSGTPTGTFTYTPASTGAKSISTTNNGSLTNPSNLSYTSNAVVSAPAPAPQPTAGMQLIQLGIDLQNGHFIFMPHG